MTGTEEKDLKEESVEILATLETEAPQKTTVETDLPVISLILVKKTVMIGCP